MVVWTGDNRAYCFNVPPHAGAVVEREVCHNQVRPLRLARVNFS
jgi:hypothetical protein